MIEPINCWTEVAAIGLLIVAGVGRVAEALPPAEGAAAQTRVIADSAAELGKRDWALRNASHAPAASPADSLVRPSS